MGFAYFVIGFLLFHDHRGGVSKQSFYRLFGVAMWHGHGNLILLNHGWWALSWE